MSNYVNYEFVTDKWITIDDQPKHDKVQRTETEERERYRHWSNYWRKKNQIKAGASW